MSRYEIILAAHWDAPLVRAAPRQWRSRRVICTVGFASAMDNCSAFGRGERSAAPPPATNTKGLWR
jgi:hypothetical protein